MVQWCRRRVSTGGAPLVEEIEDDEPCFAGASTGLPGCTRVLPVFGLTVDAQPKLLGGF